VLGGSGQRTASNTDQTATERLPERSAGINDAGGVLPRDNSVDCDPCAFCPVTVLRDVCCDLTKCARTAMGHANRPLLRVAGNHPPGNLSFRVKPPRP
jgi:hypothetical protein